MDELEYRGHIAVKIGPGALRFRGIAKFTDFDDADRRASIPAQAKDNKGHGGMLALVDFYLEPMVERSDCALL